MIFFIRELRDTKQRFEQIGNDMKRKENQIMDLQNRLGDGCELFYNKYGTDFKISYQFPVLERPSSQMSYLEHFLKESSGGGNTGTGSAGREGSSSSNTAQTPQTSSNVVRNFEFSQKLFETDFSTNFSSNTHHQIQHHSAHHIKIVTITT